MPGLNWTGEEKSSIKGSENNLSESLVKAMQQSPTGNLVPRSPTGRLMGPTYKHPRDLGTRIRVRLHMPGLAVPATVIRRGRIQSSLITRK